MHNRRKQRQARLRMIGLEDRVFRIPPYQQEKYVAREGAAMSLNLMLPNIPDLWRESEGRAIKIAVLDTGVDVEHPALASNIKGKENFTGGPAEDVKDEEGHGTMVAGVIAAHGASISLTGVAPKADLFIGKVIRQAEGGAVGDVKRGIE